MANLTQKQYYTNDGISPKDKNWGSYQYVTLENIIRNFILMYVGDDKVINKVDREEVIFHGKRGLQEIHYDALREIRAIEFLVPDSLKFALPHDFVSLVKIGWVGTDGLVHPIMQDFDASSPNAFVQDTTDTTTRDFDFSSSTSLTEETSTIYTNWKDVEKGNLNEPNKYLYGRRYGLETKKGNFNSRYHIDKKQGFVLFNTTLQEKDIVIEYVSDGMYGLADNEIEVHKLAEQFMYDYMNAQVLRSKFNVQEFIVRRANKQASASLKNLKIRLNSIKLHELTQILRGRDKWIK